jgi:hypothetical protein
MITNQPADKSLMSQQHHASMHEVHRAAAHCWLLFVCCQTSLHTCGPAAAGSTCLHFTHAVASQHMVTAAPWPLFQWHHLLVKDQQRSTLLHACCQLGVAGSRSAASSSLVVAPE